MASAQGNVVRRLWNTGPQVLDPAGRQNLASLSGRGRQDADVSHPLPEAAPNGLPLATLLRRAAA